MELTRALALIFLNQVAFQYAICAALVLAPLYAYVLKPLLQPSRQRASATPAFAAPPAAATPVRLSTASSKGFRSPASVGATPADFEPIFGSAATPMDATPPSRLNGGSSSRRGSTGLSLASTEAPSLEVTGTALAVEEEAYRSPTQRVVSALRRHVQIGSAALLNGGDSDGALKAAVQSGEVYLYCRSSLDLPSQDYLAQRLLQRQRLQEEYDRSNITDAALDALYARPAFQQWYAANRQQLVREVHLRESYAMWRSVATAVVLLAALLLLPAYSFSTQTTALQWTAPLPTHPDASAASAAPLAQLLATRLHYIQYERSATRTSRGVQALVTASVNVAEYVAVITAACAFVTSCFMPRENGSTATVALVSFLVLVGESAMVAAASVQLGLGFLVAMAIVLRSIYRAAA